MSILPALRGIASRTSASSRTYTDHEDALDVCRLKLGAGAGQLGTSCPDHFLRTRICPMFVDWKPARRDVDDLKNHLEEQRGRLSRRVRRAITKTGRRQILRSCAIPILRSLSFRALGLFGFGKNKKEARITTEFFINAIHVMAGAMRSRRRRSPHPLSAGTPPEQSQEFASSRQLRGAAALRGFPDRILGARRGQAAAHAGGSRVQPQDRC